MLRVEITRNIINNNTGTGKRPVLFVRTRKNPAESESLQPPMYESIYHTKDISGTSFLVTGGAGFIGSHLAQYLLKSGARKVRVMDSLLTGLQSNIDLFSGEKSYEFFRGDTRNAEDCKQACNGIDIVLHQAALGSVPRSIKDPMTSNAVNVDGFLQILWAAKEAGVKRFVYASSSSVYGDHPALPKQEENIGRQLSPYAVSKYANELYAHVFYSVYKMEIIGLRYFNIFGPRQDPNGPYAAVIPLFIQALRKGEAPIIHGDGLQTRDFTFVENAVQANIRAATTSHPEAIGKVYNIAFGENYSLLKLYETIQQMIGKTLPPRHVESRAGDIRNSLADISRARQLLGYNPLFNMEQGMRITVDSY